MSMIKGAAQVRMSAAQAKHLRGQKNYVLTGLKVASFAVGMIPVIGATAFGISWLTDHFVNGQEANRELNLRTKFYADQIGAVMGMDPKNVTVKDFAAAAKINPALGKLYREPLKARDNENRSSTLLNGGAFAAIGLLPFGHATSHGLAHGSKAMIEAVRGTMSMAAMAKSTAGSLAGGALGKALSQETLKTQELVEALESAMADAGKKGIPLNEAVNPQLIFLVRVSQDAALEAQIKKQFGKPVHKMTAEQISGVMNSFPELANASQREAYAVVNNIMTVRDIAASAPNMRGNFAGPMVQASNGSHVARLQAQRSAAAAQGVTA